MNKSLTLRINTSSLFEQFLKREKNLSFTKEGTTLQKTVVYENEGSVFHENFITLQDVACDENNVIYFIDRQEGVLYSYEKINGLFTKKGCPPGVLPFSMVSLQSVAVDRDTVYLVDNGDEESSARLIALEKEGLQPRWVLDRDDEGAPLSFLSHINRFRDQGIYALEAAKGRLLHIKKDGTAVAIPGCGKLSKPTDIAIKDDGEAAILDGRTVHLLKKGGIHKTLLLTKEEIPFPPKGIVFDLAGNLIIGEEGAEDPSQMTLHRIDGDGRGTPLWSYRDSTSKLTCDAVGNLYVINGNGSRLTRLAHKLLYAADNDGNYEGLYFSQAVDSGKFRTVWDRFLLEGDFPEGSHIEFHYYASDDINDEKKEHPWNEGLTGVSSFQGTQKRDSLFREKNQGQYLWFKIRISGNELLSPRLHSLTLHFPRLSLIDHLPTLYRDDPLSSDFLDRFLALFQGFLDTLDWEISTLTRYFDAIGCPPEFLSWLESWVALSTDESWDRDRRRLLISQAATLYRKRGTRDGLADILEIYTGKRPYIVEIHHYPAQCRSSEKSDTPREPASFSDTIYLPIPGTKIVAPGKEEGCCPKEKKQESRKQKNSSLLIDTLYGREKFYFYVLLKNRDLTEKQLKTINRLIEENKPAYTAYGVKVLQPWFYLDAHTYLGVNSEIGDPEFILDHSSLIGQDSLLETREKGGQMNRKARLAIDSPLT